MAGEIFYDAHTGKLCYLADRFADPAGEYMFASADVGKALCMGAGTSFWLPQSTKEPYGDVFGHMATYFSLYSGLTVSPYADTESGQRQAIVAWIEGLTDFEPLLQTSPWSAGAYNTAKTFYRDGSTGKTSPYFQMCLTEDVGIQRYWACCSCAGCTVKTVRLEVFEGLLSDLTSISESWPLRVAFFWTDAGLSEAEMRTATPWRIADIRALPHVDVISYGTYDVDVSALGMVQEVGKLLFAIVYFDFLMPPAWDLSGGFYNRFEAGAFIRDIELAIP